MSYCRKCGNQLSDDSVFCSKCGLKQTDPLAVSDSSSIQSRNTSDSDENPMYFRYSEKALTKKIMVIVFFIVSLIFLRGFPALFDIEIPLAGSDGFLILMILCIAEVIWSCVLLQKQYLRINKDSISGAAAGFFINTEVHNLSLKRITDVKTVDDTLLMVFADRAYYFNVENAEKAHMELHKKIHNH